MKDKGDKVALYFSALACYEEIRNDSDDKTEHGSKACQEGLQKILP